jgi:hypothetical protein
VRRPAVIALALALGAAPTFAQDAPTETPPAPAVTAQPKKAPPAKPPAPKTAARPKPAPPPAEAETGPPAPPPPPTPPLLGFCAQPVRPACVDSAATYADPKTKAACNQDMERYVKFVFAFRICLNAEMERAVRQTNETIFRHKCRMAGGKKC